MKIALIGGGNNSNIDSDGFERIYEHENIDREIISLSEKNKPNVLFLSHAANLGTERRSFNKVLNTYSKMYGCPLELHTTRMIHDYEVSSELISWADIIYVGGGNTKRMIELWTSFGFDKLLKQAMLDNKVLCGISAGANCWCHSSCSDYLQMERNDPNAPYALVDGLGFCDFILNPHANYPGRLNGLKELLKDSDKVGVSLTNNSAMFICDKDYKIVKGISSYGDEIDAYISYFDNGKYYFKKMEEKGKIRQLVRK